MSRYQKGKTNLDFTEARDSEWQWHQLGHMQVCTSLQTDNHASTPPLSFLLARCSSCRPTNSVKALKAMEGLLLSKHIRSSKRRKQTSQTFWTDHLIVFKTTEAEIEKSWCPLVLSLCNPYPLMLLWAIISMIHATWSTHLPKTLSNLHHWELGLEIQYRCSKFHFLKSQSTPEERMMFSKLRLW